jgi:endonuclease/exonuclease/phosphatase family metal-dependent hydrolase
VGSGNPEKSRFASRADRKLTGAEHTGSRAGGAAGFVRPRYNGDVVAAGAMRSRACAQVEAVPAARRAAIADGPATPEAHAALLAELPFADAVEVQPPRPPNAGAALGRAARIVAWNVERGRHVEAIAGLLAASGADIALLTELDCGMARSGQRHVARDLARQLGFAYAFAVEFLELGLGGPGERAKLAPDAENEIGYHGNAILSRTPLQRPAVVRLGDDAAWFDGARGERRVGGRIAVVAQVTVSGVNITTAVVHLESHGNPAQRATQIMALLDALDAYDPHAPVVIGGDLNTFSLGLEQVSDRDAVAAALRADPERWRRPERHEPLFALVEARGYQWRAANVAGEPTHRHAAGSGSTRGQLKLDWLLVRGIAASDPAVLEAAHPATGAALSDHEPVAATVTVGA